MEEVDREISQIRTQINKMKLKGGICLAGDFNAKIKINTDHAQQNGNRNANQYKHTMPVMMMGI